jgi:hypothetical protein
VWADQRERLQRLQAAIELARAHRIRVEASDAADWVERELAAPSPSMTMVLVHSIVWQYLPHATRRRVRNQLDRIGAQAGTQAPVAWLRFEPLRANEPPWLQLTLWPGARTERLAQAHPHDQWVQWTPRR